MTISPNGISFIESLEGIKLQAYADSSGVWTIGVGHTAGVKQGDTCNQQQVDQWLLEDLGVAEACINDCVTVPLSQNQYDALVSFTFNVGCHAFRTSTLLVLLNRGQIAGAANQFLAWNRAGGNAVTGLTNRRIRERELFLS